LAHALRAADTDYKVEGFDADHSAQFWDWSQEDKGDFDFTVHRQPLARYYRTMQKPTTPMYVGVIDCGHTENHPDITNAVLRIADLVIVHMAPTSGDFERVVDPADATPLLDIINGSQGTRPDERPPKTWVLLNRCAHNASSVKHYREQMEEEGYNVFTTTIPRTEKLAQVIGFPVSQTAVRYFAPLVTEMEERGLLPR